MNSSSDEFDLALSYQESIPENVIDEFRAQLENSNVRLKIDRRPIEIFAGIEWSIPTIVVVFFASAYFQSFMKKAGEDHYVLLKSAFLRLFEHLFGDEPENREECRSQLVSVISKSRDGVPIKFIFSEGMSQDANEKMIDALIKILSEHHAFSKNDDLAKILQSATSQRFLGSFYLEYSIEQKEWISINPKSEIDRAVKKTSSKP